MDDLACRVVEFSCGVVQISLGLLECFTAGRELQRQDTRQLGHSVILISEINNVCGQYSCSCVNTNMLNVKKSPSKCLTHDVHQQLLAGLSDAPEGHVNILLAWQAIHTIIQGV